MEKEKDIYCIVRKIPNEITNVMKPFHNKTSLVSHEQVKKYVTLHNKGRRDGMPIIGETNRNADMQFDWETMSKLRNQQDEANAIRNFANKVECLHLECGIPFLDLQQIGADDFDVYSHVVMHQIQEWAPFEELIEMGSEMCFCVKNFEKITVDIGTGIFGDLPKEYSWLPRRYIFALAIRVAREIFTFLPVQKITIHVGESLQNMMSSNMCWLHVDFGREIVLKTDFHKIDCEKYIQQFNNEYQLDNGIGFTLTKINKKDEIKYETKLFEENH